MVYKKYITRNGKRFGPYYCESYRDKDGKVKTRFVSGPKRRHKIIRKIKQTKINLGKPNLKLVFLFSVIFISILLVFLIGNINYSLNERDITGRVVGDIEDIKNIEIKEKLAEKIASKEIVSNVDIREKVDLKVKKPMFNNKIMSFNTAEGEIKLDFDLLDYAKWVEADVEDEIFDDNFDIDVQESNEKYKWGYNVRLNDLNFMAKIEISADNDIVIINNETLKIGEFYLSFADLVDEGYIVRVENPVVLGEVNISEVNISEINVSMGNIGEINISEFNQTEIEIILNETEEIDSGENVIINETEIVVNETELEVNTSEEEVVEVVVEDVEEIEQEIEESIGDEGGVENVEQLEEEVVGEEIEESEEAVEESKDSVNLITGFFVRGFKGITGFVVKDKKTISIYIERDFNGTNYSVGDIINLDPFLIIIEIIKAQHLSSERVFISDIYEEVKAQDGIWSEVIGDGEYVRVKFEENLTREKDITIYARSVGGGNGTPECYDDKTEILSENGWKLFKDLDDEKVMTLNAKTGEKEWQLPVERQIFDNDGEMYKIVLEDGKGLESEMLVSKEHKVYTNLISDQSNNSIMSLVDNTLTLDCFLNAGSFDQIAQFNLSASANTGRSLSCVSFLACGSNSLQELSGNNLIKDNNSFNFVSNCFELSLEYFRTSCLFFFNSLSIYSEENRFKLKDLDLEINSLTGFGLKNENNILVSTTNFIYQPSFFNLSQTDSLILSPNMSACSSNSLSDSNCCSICFFQSNLATLDSVYFLNKPDQFISENSSIFCLSSSGKEIVKFGIFSQNIQKTQIFKSFDLRAVVEVYSGFKNGEKIYFLDSENKPVKVLNISKENYNGKIYDVDVENDIVLVRRNKIVCEDEQVKEITNSDLDNNNNNNNNNNNENGGKGLEVSDSECREVVGRAVWSGNSDNGTMQGVQIEVYEKDGIEVIAKFENVSDENWYKIYLTNLSEGLDYTQDVFDLKILGVGGVEFDYIVDPTADGTGNNVYQCGTLDSSGVYQMNQSITNNTLTTPCINITTQNITLDCAGFDIVSSSNEAGIYSNQINTTIKGCNVSMGASSGGIGIELNGANNSYIWNNTLNGQYDGLSFNSINNTRIESNTANSNSNRGIYISTSSNNNLTNNIANLNNDGFYIDSSSNNNLTNNTANSNSNGGFFFTTSSNNNLLTNIKADSNLVEIYFNDNANNNNITDSNFSNSTTAVYISNSINNIFLNVSYDVSKETIPTAGSLIRKWYYQTYVNDTNGNDVSGANVLAYNSSGSLIFNATTNSSGWINKTAIIEYVNFGGTRTYYSNYSINARNSSYPDGIISKNITGNVLDDVITMSEVAGCGWLTTSGTYTQSQNIVNNELVHSCINITTQNVTLDCGGFDISSDDGVAGVYSDQINTTIRGCNISMLTSSTGYGIELNGANNSYIWNNTLNNQHYGLVLSETYNTTIENNIANSNSLKGIYFMLSSNNNLTNNTVNSNVLHGISFIESSNNIILNNNVSSNSGHGISLTLSLNNSLINNIANSNSWKGIYFILSSNNNLTNNIANSNSWNGISIHSGSNNNNLTNNIANSNSWDGISLTSSSNNSLTNNIANSNSWDGISLSSSSNNSLINNTINSNSLDGISLSASNNNQIINNNINNCSTTAGYGCIFVQGDNNIFINNKVNKSFDFGINVDGDNNLFKNTNMTNIDGTSVRVYLGELNNTFLNFSYNNESVASGGELIRKWYYQAYVEDIFGNDFASANITAYNSTGNYNFNLTTNSSGWTPIGEIIDYVNLGGVTSYYSPYDIYARNASLSFATHSYNVTFYENNLTDSFTIDTIDPVVTMISASSTVYTYNVSDNSSIASCSLVLGGSVVASDADVNNSGGTETISYSAGAGTYTYYISCTDIAGNVGNSSSSTIVITTITQLVSGGGGGGGTRRVSLVVNALSPIFLYEVGEVEVPITLYNNGEVDLNDIDLVSSVFRDSILVDVNTRFSQEHFDFINKGQSEEIILTAEMTVADVGSEILINATSNNPEYGASDRVIVNFVGEDSSEINKMLVFVDNMVVENPECLELKEIIREAEEAFEEGDFKLAIEKANSAIELCKDSISGPKQISYPTLKGGINKNILFYLVIGILGAIVFALIFNIYKRIKFRKK